MMTDAIDSPFEFVAEIAALNLVNTEVIIRRKQRDLLKSPDNLALWWEHAQHVDPELDVVIGVPPQFDSELLAETKSFRKSLRRLFTAIIEQRVPETADTEHLNTFLGRGHPLLSWETDDRPQLQYWHGDDRHAGVLLPIALSAMKVLTNLDLGRLRKCHNDHCILLFYDTTKSGTRQWCTTKCFDRERSARRYDEQKLEEGEDGQ